MHGDGRRLKPAVICGPGIVSSNSHRRGEPLAKRTGVIATVANEIYNAETFRHFLTLERSRAARAERAFLLVLVGVRVRPKTGVRVSATESAALFTALGECVRDVDFVGWYREGRVAGAVLTQGVEGPGSHAPTVIGERVSQVLRRRLPVALSQSLRVRVLRLGPTGGV